MRRTYHAGLALVILLAVGCVLLRESVTLRGEQFTAICIGTNERGVGIVVWTNVGGGMPNANTVYVDKNPTALGPGAFSTFAEALASITNAAETNLYVIKAGVGTFTDSEVTWKDYVSLKGEGFDYTKIVNGVNYVAGSGVQSRVFFADFQTSTGLSVRLWPGDSVNTLCFFKRLKGPITYDGGTNFNVLNYNNAFLYDSHVSAVWVKSGMFHAYGNHAILSSLQIDGDPTVPAPTTLPTSVEIIGGYNQGTWTISGNATLTTRGAISTYDLAGSIVAGVTPTLDTDFSSYTSGTISGALSVSTNFFKLPMAVSTNGPSGFGAIITNGTGRVFVVHSVRFNSTIGSTNSVKLFHITGTQTNTIDEYTVFNSRLTNITTLKGFINPNAITILSTNDSRGNGTRLYITNGYNKTQL